MKPHLQRWRLIWRCVVPDPGCTRQKPLSMLTRNQIGYGATPEKAYDAWVSGIQANHLAHGYLPAPLSMSGTAWRKIWYDPQQQRIMTRDLSPEEWFQLYSTMETG